MALLAKWLTRYKACNGSLWVKVISAVHKSIRKWDTIPVKSSLGGTWRNIVYGDRGGNMDNRKMVERLKPQVGKGDKTLFWLDCWVGDKPLKELFPLLFKLEKQKDVFLMECYEWINNELGWKWRWKKRPTSGQLQFEQLNCVLSSVVLSLAEDKWRWQESDGSFADFLVSSFRWEYDNLVHPVVDFMLWLKWVPIKINCFIWRLLLDRIATKWALSTRGIIILEDVCCVFCGDSAETTQHMFVQCKVTKVIWSFILDWVKLPRRPNFISVEEILDFPSKIAVQSILAVTCWIIWLSRNDFIFKNVPFVCSKMVNDIKATSFLWVKQRSKSTNLKWDDWCRFNFVNFPI
ncbi:uncharacterized protein LOC143543750 [Bidens hawaiensis]|uniref:uncharacterized protein LOC143543750 n=1 Tax=Bidens hawaiensis TaxID=980011 RepID=UPI00404A13D9